VRAECCNRGSMSLRIHMSVICDISHLLQDDFVAQHARAEGYHRRKKLCILQFGPCRPPPRAPSNRHIGAYYIGYISYSSLQYVTYFSPALLRYQARPLLAR
jgi:hypothetical protein